MARFRTMKNNPNPTKGQNHCGGIDTAALRSEGNMAKIENTPTLSKSASSVLNMIRKQAIGSCFVAGMATSLMLASSNVHALGLGVLDVQSNLDQPLNGTITINLSPGDDLNTLTAQVASREEFESLGVDYPEYLQNIKLVVDRTGEGAVLRVNSNGVVIKEPFIHFLVKVSWSGGNFLREYTALIDPPVYAAETPKSFSQPKSVGTDQSYADQEEPVSSYEETATPTVEEVDNSIASDSSTSSGSGSLPTDASYGPVEAGESLSLIAQELQRQVPDLSIYSIMKVLFEENPNAFIDNNINGLIKGSILNIGDLNQIRATEVESARAFFQAQLADWNPNSLISRRDSDSGIGVTNDTYDSGASDSGASSNSASDAQDNFQIGSSTETGSFVSASTGDSSEGEVLALRDEITQLQGSLASSELENQELSERIAILESQLEDMNRLMSLSVENADLAVLEKTLAENAEAKTQLENQADTALDEFTADDGIIDDTLAGVDAAVDGVVDSIDGVDVAEPAGNVDDILNEFLDDSAEGVDGDALVADSNDTLNEDGLLEDGILTDGDELDSESVIEEITDQDELAVAEPVKPAVVTPAVKETSLLDKFGGIVPVLSGLGGTLLVGGLALFFIRRRKADEEFEISMLSIESNSQSIDVDTKSGQSASLSSTVSTSTSEHGDTEAGDEPIDKETSFLTVYSDSDAVVQADEVDPIAEADVYIAYGRDEQAEEVLLDGVVNYPDRVDVKHKLLGLYHKNENKEGFERVAEELYAQRDSVSNEAWQEISDMGKDLLPDNPLFALSGADLEAVGKASVEINEEQEGTSTEDEALIFDTVDESADADILAAQAEQEEAEDALADLETALPEDEESVHLIQLDEERSEISELDDIQIDALPVNDDVDAIEFDIQGLDDAEANVAEVDLDSGLEVELSEEDLVFDLDADTDEAQDDEAEFGSERKISEVPEVSDLVIDPDYDEAQTQYELAKVFVDLGDDDGARKILEELVDNDQNADELVKNAKELLSSIAS